MMVYVGDNLAKDFQAPQQLGMKRVYFRNLVGLYFDFSQNHTLLKVYRKFVYLLICKEVKVCQ